MQLLRGRASSDCSGIILSRFSDADKPTMKLSDLTYRLYRGSTGSSSFWRWEVVHKKRLKVPLKSGFVYGTMADAKKRSSEAMLQLADTGKTGRKNKK